MNAKVLKLLQLARARLGEPSTWASVAAIVALGHHHLTEETVAGLAALGGLLAALAGVLLPEG